MEEKYFPTQFVEKTSPSNDDYLVIADSTDSNKVKKIKFSQTKWDKWDSIVWRGTYSGATAYVVNDVVSYNSLPYICILASTWNLPTNVTYWGKFVDFVNADATNRWLLEACDVTDMASGTVTWWSGAKVAVTTDFTKKGATSAADENKVPVLNSSGKLDWSVIPSVNIAYFWSWADGAVTDANLTITWSNNTYIQKNYTSWAAGTTARTFTVTPTNCIVHIRIQGDANFTNWNLDFSGKWWAGWASVAASVAWLAGTIGNSNTLSICANGSGGWAAWWAVWAAAAKATNTLLTTALDNTVLYAFCGAGGWSWWGWTSSGGGWNWGAWWAWWWCIIFEIWGNVTFSSTTATVAWGNWSNGVAGTASSWWGGWGWGWAWWSFILLYQGSLTGSLTPTITGGTGWTWGVWWANQWWAWASWWATLFTASVAGTANSGKDWWAWSAGAVWNSLIRKI